MLHWRSDVIFWVQALSSFLGMYPCPPLSRPKCSRLVACWTYVHLLAMSLSTHLIVERMHDVIPPRYSRVFNLRRPSEQHSPAVLSSVCVCSTPQVGDEFFSCPPFQYPRLTSPAGGVACRPLALLLSIIRAGYHAFSL